MHTFAGLDVDTLATKPLSNKIAQALNSSLLLAGVHGEVHLPSPGPVVDRPCLPVDGIHPFLADSVQKALTPPVRAKAGPVETKSR